MQFEKGIWQAAWEVYRVNLKTVAIAIGFMIALDLFTDYMGKAGSYRTVADLFVWSMVAISMHGTVLLNKVNLASTDSKLLMPFVWRSFVLLLLIMVPFFIAVFSFHETGEIWLSLLKAMPVAGLAVLVIFALLGTWLPATVVNGDKRIGTAFARGRRTFAYAVPRLLLGPGVLQIILVAGIFLTLSQGILAGEVIGAGGFSLVDLISLPVIYAVRAFMVTILAVILSRAYLLGEQATTSPSADSLTPT